MNFRVICDTREMLNEAENQQSAYSDHPSRANLDTFVNAAINQGFDISYFGGIERIIASIHEREKFPGSIFVNFSDGLTHDYARVQVPVLCELLNVPYSGSGVFSSAIANNKRCACDVVERAGVDVPKGFRVSRMTSVDRACLEKLLPVFVKPNCEGSSMGITSDSLQSTLDGALEQIRALLGDYNEIAVEHYISGRDITVFVLGNPPDFELIEPIVLQAENRAFLDLEAKKERLVHRFSPRCLLSEDEVSRVRLLSKRIFETLECRDICRIDFKVDELGRFYFIEANSAPRFSKTSEIGFLANSKGKEYDDYVKLFLDIVSKRVNRGAV